MSGFNEWYEQEEAEEPPTVAPGRIPSQAPVGVSSLAGYPYRRPEFRLGFYDLRDGDEPMVGPQTPSDPAAVGPESSAAATPVGPETDSRAPEAGPETSSDAEQQLVQNAIASGIRNSRQLSNMIFFARHPSLKGRPMGGDAGLSAEWSQIRARLVLPALQQLVGARKVMVRRRRARSRGLHGFSTFGFGAPAVAQFIPINERGKEMNMYYRAPVNLGQPVVSPPPFPPPALTVFPNIDAKMPALSRAALDSVLAVQKLKWFNDTYQNLAQATANSILALDDADRVIVVPTEMKSVEKLAPKFIKAFAKKAGLSLVGELVGKNLAKVLGLMPILFDLLVALTADDRKNLVSEQNRSRRMEAYRFKLRFFIRLYLTEFSIGGPGADPNQQAWVVEKLFFDYQKVLNEWWKYLDIEGNLKQGMNPYQPRPATMGPG